MLLHRSSPPRLQFGFPKLTEIEKHKQDEEAQKHSQLKEQNNSHEAANNETDLCSLRDTEFKINPEGIKGEYERIKSG